jgi:hypothetical protein
VPSLAVLHSVMKERTHLQTQWKKSGALDMSLKDWVVLSADDTTAKVRTCSQPSWDYTTLLYTVNAIKLPARIRFHHVRFLTAR